MFKSVGFSLRESIRNCDGVLIATPEYNFSIPGVLKNALEVPAGRLGDSAEFGIACAWLCSVHTGYITGQNLLLDGGGYPGML